MNRFLFFSVILCAVVAGVWTAQAAGEPLTVRVHDTSGTGTLRPLTGGVPLARGVAPDGVDFLLLRKDGTPVPCQTSILARWKDGSARWVLLDFQAAPPPNETATFQLKTKDSAEPVAPKTPIQVLGRSPVSIQTGSLGLSTSKDALLRIGERIDVGLTLRDSDGQLCRAKIESSEIETEGPVRSTLALRGAFRTPGGQRLFSFQIRASLFAGLSLVCLEPLVSIDAEKGLIQNIRELRLDLTPHSPIRSAAIGGAPGWNGQPETPLRLMQVDDENYNFEGVPGRGGKAPGWAEIDDGRGAVAVALRDFWQQWPKSIEADAKHLGLGLFPKFEEGAFAHMKPWYKHQYLFESNHYRLRAGQARRWRIWLDLSGKGAALAKFANAPLVPVADPAQAIATGVWDAVAPAGSPEMEAYDRWAENLFDNGYVRSIETQRDYGAMNWGDWWGERGCNWGNHEYDTPKHFLVQFARTGDPKYFYVGETAARHTSEVDVIHSVNDDLRAYFEETLGGNPHYPVRPGMVHEHCVGHVGGFDSVEKIRELFVSLNIGKTKSPYLCLDPYNLGHIWTQGMVYQYFLTGDPWVRDTVLCIGENLVQLVVDREFRGFSGSSHSGRVNGWTMLAIAGAYELDLTNQRYLNAMKLLADDALEEQDSHCGGWLYTLPWGHCFCDTKHVGEAGFINSVRLNGLSRYYELSGDERIPDAVQRGVTFLNRDTWEEQYSGWRYTSCPASSSGPGRQTGVTIMALVNSVKLTGDTEHLRILRKAWDAKFEGLSVAPKATPGLGKAYSTIMYGCPEAMNLFVNGLAK